MKSYTDLEQSKKLEEILHLESADMYYAHGAVAPDIMIGSKQDYRCYTKCWSLAALIGVLPYPSLHKTFSGWRCDSYNKEGTSCTLGESSDNPVDACVEIIVLLNELKML